MLPLLLLSILPSIVSTDTLLQVQVLHRHGDRTPIWTYKNDPYANYWNLPEGTLTKIGMKQHFLQGTRLRKRYIESLQFVNGSYDPSEIHIQSADTPRCIQSVASNMAAFYQHSTFHPTDVDEWPYNWTPMAIHTVPWEMDNVQQMVEWKSIQELKRVTNRLNKIYDTKSLIQSQNHLFSSQDHWSTLLVSGVPYPNVVQTIPSGRRQLLEEGGSCYRVQALREKRLQRDEYKNYILQNAQLLVELTIGSGMQVTDYEAIDQLHDTLKVERLYNLTLPSWANDTVMNQLQAAYIETDDFVDGMAALGAPEDVELLSLRSGTLLGQLIDNMNSAIAGKGTKMNLFSAHDSTISALFRIFHNKYAVLGQKNPDYAAMVAFELWKTTSGQYYVQVMYSNDCYTDFHPITNTIQGCPNSTNCPLNTLASHYKSYIPTDFWKQCANGTV